MRWRIPSLEWREILTRVWFISQSNKGGVYYVYWQRVGDSESRWMGDEEIEVSRWRWLLVRSLLHERPLRLRQTERQGEWQCRENMTVLVITNADETIRWMGQQVSWSFVVDDWTNRLDLPSKKVDTTDRETEREQENEKQERDQRWKR